MYGALFESATLFPPRSNTILRRFAKTRSSSMLSFLEASSLSLGRSAIAIVEEDKRCFACTTFPEPGIASQCIVPCHYSQRCYLKATNANGTRKLVLAALLFARCEREKERERKGTNASLLKSLIAVARTSDGSVICSSMVVSHTTVSIGVCVRLIYAIPVTITRFVVRRTIDWKLEHHFWTCLRC